MRDFFYHLFIPRQSNNYKARSLHLSSLISYILLMIIFQLVLNFSTVSNPQVLGIATNINAEVLLELTSRERIKHGLEALKFDQDLTRAAYQKAYHMFSHDYWSHNSPDGITPWSFISQQQYDYAYAGENLARDFDTSAGVVNAWMVSATHRENILQSKFVDVGFAVVNGKLNGVETTLVVQMFGKRQGVSLSKEIQIPREETIPVVSQQPQPVLPEMTIKELKQINLVKKPVIDVNVTRKGAVSVFLLIISSVLIIDGFLVTRKHAYRLSGKNQAHLLLMLALLMMVLMTTRGQII